MYVECVLRNSTNLREDRQNLYLIFHWINVHVSCLSQPTIFHLWAVAHLKSDKMAAIPSSGSLVATHDYYRREWGVSCVYILAIVAGQIILFIFIN